MIQLFKNLVIKILDLAGYKIIGKKNLVTHNSFNAIHDYIIKSLNNEKKNIIIFDIGANEGDSITRFRKIFPLAEIHSFEPTQYLIKKMKSFSDMNNLKINNFAIGNEISERNFFFYNSHRVNSFYPMEKGSKYRIQRTNKNTEIEKENMEKVKVITIDHYCKINNISYINLLKIDTQGSEAEALQGAAGLLKNQAVDVIELEYILGIAHKDSNSLYDIESSLDKFNYKLIAIESSGNVLSFSNYQTNLIYVKKRIFEKIKNLHEKNISLKGITFSVKSKEK